MALKENYTDGETLTAAAFNEVTDQVNTITDTGLASIRANRNLHGGGTITVDASYNVLWSARFLVISNGRGTTFGTAGYFEINCPVTGTITGVGGAANKTATAAGIPLAVYEALYYIMPIGAVQTSLAANFRVASYTSDFAIPYNWVLICIRNGDSNAVTFNNGITLSASQSLNSIKQSNANIANTLVRRDASGNFSAGTVTASTLVSNVATGTAPLTVTSTTQVSNLNAQYLSGAGQTSAATASTIAARDANANLNADNFVNTVESTATAATVTTLTMANGGVQVFTGATTQTVVLPSGASVLAGVQFTIINQSTAGAIAVQYPAGTLLVSVPVGHSGEFTALASNPTLVTHWRATVFAQTAGVMATTSNTLAAFNQSTTNAIGVGTIELGHASDTTLARVSAGVVSVEGNPLGVKVAVPATATSAGVVGQWAADASWLYICTAATTWRRVAIAAW